MRLGSREEILKEPSHTRKALFRKLRRHKKHIAKQRANNRTKKIVKTKKPKNKK